MLNFSLSLQQSNSNLRHYEEVYFVIIDLFTNDGTGTENQSPRDNPFNGVRDTKDDGSR